MRSSLIGEPGAAGIRRSSPRGGVMSKGGEEGEEA